MGKRRRSDNVRVDWTLIIEEPDGRKIRLDTDPNNPEDRASGERAVSNLSSAAVSERPQQEGTRRLFSEVAAEYLSDRKDARRARTSAAYENTFRWWVDITGDLPFGSLRVEHVRKFRDKMKLTPPNPRRGARFVGMNGAEIIARQVKNPSRQVIDQKTHYEHCNRITALFAWSVETHRPGELIAFNPAKRDMPSRPKRAPVDRSFSKDDLNAIFDGWIYREAQKSRQKNWYDAYFWLPLFGLYVGGRIEEVASLRLDDFQRTGAVATVHLRGEKTLATPGQSQYRIVY